MSHRLELPAELLSLIEKRELEDRRQGILTPEKDAAVAAANDLDERRRGPRRADEQSPD